jgi:hypothetical protein
MKKIAVFLLALTSASAVQAQQRPFTPSLSCGQAQQIVLSRGAAVLGTGANTYDRYVRDRSFCQVSEYLENAWVPTRDTPQCPVGYRCSTNLPFYLDD